MPAGAAVKPVATTVAAKPGSANSPANSPAFLNAAQTVYGDLNSGNYTGAWNTALGTSSMFGTGMSATTKDPLLQALETSQGLKQFDPTKQWNSSSLDAYYSAFNSTNAYHGNNSGSNGYLGANPYGDWGAASAIQSGSDQKANIAQEGDTPDVARFAGAKPTHSFLSKYGGDIVSVVGDVAGSFVGDPMAGNQIMAAYDATQGNWAGALGNAASSFVPGLGAAAGSALNIGTTAGSALVGAGLGATEAGLTKGNPLLGALGGAASGAIGSSGIKGDVSGAVSGTVGNTAGNVLGSVAQGGLNVGAGMAVGALGAEMAGGSKPPPATQSQTANQNGNIPATAKTATPGAPPMSTIQSIGPAQSGSPATAGGGSPAGGWVGAASSLLPATAGGGSPATAGGGTNYIGSGTSTQGTNGNTMGSDTSSNLAGTITGALPGVLQAGIGTAASLAASNAETNAYGNAITTQQNTMGNINNLWSTQQGLGVGADTALGSALGTNGAAPNYSGFENMPGYQFAVSQGTQAIQRQAAAMGNAYTPNTAAAVGQYVTGTAAQDYNTYISQLMGAAGLGSTANTQLQGANINAGNNISTLQGNIGKAQAQGYLGTADSVNSLFGTNGAGTGLINAAGKALGSGGGGGGGGSGGGGSGGGFGAPAGGDVNGGTDPSTGMPYDIENPANSSYTAPTYDPSNPLGISGYTDPTSSYGSNWSSVSDSNFNGSGDSVWNSVTDSGGGASDATSFLGDW